MARYTVHVPESETSMGSDSPLTGLQAYNKVVELRAMGFRTVSLRNVESGEEIIDVESLVRDSPNA
jgi:hypothetical protein